jgi:hypothetical protein
VPPEALAASTIRSVSVVLTIEIINFNFMSFLPSRL